MTDSIKISVLTPLYNHAEKYVRRCLESLLAQSIRDCEFILIDNGADQSNKELISEFLQKDARFSVINIVNNRGYGPAMNLGIAAARGEYIGILESDDFVAPTMFETLGTYALKTGADIVKCCFSFYWEEKGISNIQGQKYPPMKYHKLLDNYDFPEIPLSHASQWTAIYRKEMLINNDVSYSDVPSASHQDMGFMLKAWMMARKIYLIPDILHYYRMDNENQSTHKHNIVPWGSAKEYSLLAEWMYNHSSKMRDIYWYVRAKREYSNKMRFYRMMTRKKIWYLFTEMHLPFKKELQNNHVDFSLFSTKEAETYKLIAKHPVYFQLHQLFSKIFTRVENKDHTLISFLGIPLYSLDKVNDRKKKKYLFGLFKELITQEKRKRYFIGIPYNSKRKLENGKITIHEYFWGVYSTKRKSGYLKLRFLGIPFFVRNRPSQYEHDIRILGLPISKKYQTKEGWHVRNLFCRLIRFVRKNHAKKYYLLGLPLIAKKNEFGVKRIAFMGLPIYRSYSFREQFELINKRTQELGQLIQDQKIQDSFLLINRRFREVAIEFSNIRCIVEAQILHKETFGPYKNAFEGKDVVLVCTGPTARSYKMLPGAIHVGVNGAIYLNNVLLDYLFVQDYTIKQECNSDLNVDAQNYIGNNCKKFYGIISDSRLERVKDTIGRIPLHYANDDNVSQYLLEGLFKHNVAYDLSREPVGDFGGTVFSALQFILYANPKRLFLVGWDCGEGYAYGKTNALGPANIQIETVKKYILPHIQAYHSNIEIISINPVGLKGIFKDQYMENT